MEYLTTLPAGIIILVFASITIGFAGTKLAGIADMLADMTKIGEALIGGVLIGSVTSLPGIVTSVTAAYRGFPQFAVSNAIGGIILQTSFLAIADLIYRKVNLEHAAASLSNMMQGGLLIIIISIILSAKFTPAISVFHINIFSIVLIIIYLSGIKLISAVEKNPMWLPRKTRETVLDIPHYFTKSKVKIRKVWLKFFVLAFVVAIAGYGLTQAGIIIVQKTHLSESFVAGFLTAGSSSLPELIITIAAVKRKALALAVGNIIGGNTFDTLFIAGSDIAYRKGSLYHAMQTPQLFMSTLTIFLTAVLLMGLLHRQKHGPVKIGWESVVILCLTVVNYVLIFFKLL